MRLTALLKSGANKWSEQNPLLGGRGGRYSNNKRMQGMSLASLKHHTALIPLFVIMGAGVAWVAFFSLRSLTKMSDISWKHEEAPYNAYKDKQTKFLNPGGIDYAKEGKNVPNYKD